MPWQWKYVFTMKETRRTRHCCLITFSFLEIVKFIFLENKYMTTAENKNMRNERNKKREKRKKIMTKCQFLFAFIQNTTIFYR